MANYPKAGDLQRATASHLTGNPRQNPWEVRSGGELESSFSSEDDATFYADEIRRGGAAQVTVTHRTRKLPSRAEMTANPAGGAFKPGKRVVFLPNAASRALYSRAPKDGTEGTVATIPTAGGRSHVMGGLVYVDWDGYGTQGVAQYDIALVGSMADQKRRAKGNPETTFDTDVLDGMTRALWVTSYADWVESLPIAQQRELGPGAGGEWNDAAPDSPTSALLAAEDLYTAITRANYGKTPGELLDLAAAVDRKRITAEYADSFGHYLAMMALGHGVSWFDDHAQFKMKVPRFEAYTGDGEEIDWSPRIRSTQNPAGGVPKYILWEESSFGGAQIGGYVDLKSAKAEADQAAGGYKRWVTLDGTKVYPTTGASGAKRRR